MRKDFGAGASLARLEREELGPVSREMTFSKSPAGIRWPRLPARRQPS